MLKKGGEGVTKPEFNLLIKLILELLRKGDNDTVIKLLEDVIEEK